MMLFGRLLQLGLQRCMTPLSFLLFLSQPRHAVERALQLGFQGALGDLEFMHSCFRGLELLTQRGAVGHCCRLSQLGLLKLGR
ncbi:hypothetical protein D3C80_2139200 [compost metagenome]